MDQRRGLRGGLWLLLFVLFTFLVKKVDVAPVGPKGTEIGFSKLNMLVWNVVGVHHYLYTITQALGVLALLVCGYFALVGAIQLVRRRRILAVDRNILVTGGLYVVVLALYAFFEKVIVNYRPVIMPDAAMPEASYPSSHTMLICVVMISAMMLMKDYMFPNPRVRKIARIVCWVIVGVTVFGRLFCGVHWFTDIVGGVLLSAGLLNLYASLLTEPRRK